MNGRPAVSPEQARRLAAWARRLDPLLPGPPPPLPVLRLARRALVLALGVHPDDARDLAPPMLASGLLRYRARPDGSFRLIVPKGRGTAMVSAEDLAAMEQRNGKGGSHP